MTWSTAAGSTPARSRAARAGDDTEVGGGEVLEGAPEGAEAGADAGEKDDARAPGGPTHPEALQEVGRTRDILPGICPRPGATSSKTRE